MFKKYKLTEQKIELLKRLLKLKDLNEPDGYNKGKVIDLFNSKHEMSKEEIRHTRNYTILKNMNIVLKMINLMS